jgi:hypothetical protein
MDIVSKIERTKTDFRDRPSVDVKIDDCGTLAVSGNESVDL